MRMTCVSKCFHMSFLYTSNATKKSSAMYGSIAVKKIVCWFRKPAETLGLVTQKASPIHALQGSALARSSASAPRMQNIPPVAGACTKNPEETQSSLHIACGQVQSAEMTCCCQGIARMHNSTNACHRCRSLVCGVSNLFWH